MNPNEDVSTYARNLIENLLAMHALANMYRASNDREYLGAAGRWMPHVDRNVENLRAEFARLAATGAGDTSLQAHLDDAQRAIAQQPPGISETEEA